MSNDWRSSTTQPPGTVPGPAFEAIPVPPDGYVPGELLEASGPDPIKVISLQQAVELAKQLSDITGDPSELARIGRAALGIAKEFEAYLTSTDQEE